ncbi:MAG: hypothetical protein HZY76_07950 [Anaerolineae bacterium]|nr:MAG: hypothetical protein HZY76_07950 [Anaerolineae bacterium]
MPMWMKAVRSTSTSGSLYRTGRYRVTTYGNAIYNCQTSTTNNVAANVNYGLWWCGGGAGNDRSVRIYNDLYRSLRFVREQAVLGGMGGNPGEVWACGRPAVTTARTTAAVMARCT